MKSRAITAALAATLAVAVGARAQETQRLSGGEVAVYNLAGEARVVRGSGSDVVVRVTRGGADASRLRVETGTVRGRNTLRVVYPDDEIVYSELGRGSSTSTRVADDGTFGDRGSRGGRRVRIRGSGSGMEAWADLVIEMPRGTNLSVNVAVGHVEATGVEGTLRLDTGSGAIEASDITGALDLDTGSGRVTVRGVQGNLNVDTGSGRVDVTGVAGDRVSVDTGSGGVTGSDIRAGELIVDTGSGSIELGMVSSTDVSLDTGSGSVDIELLEDVEALMADTGSGSVTIRAPADLGAEVQIETGSGGIDLDFPVQVRSVRRDKLSGTIGDGRGRIVIDTGSGGIRLIRR